MEKREKELVAMEQFMSMEDAVNYLRETTNDFDPNPNKLGFFVKNAKELMFEAMKSICAQELVWRKDYEQIVDWLSSSNYKGLFVAGGYGTGKTMLCTKVIPLILLNRFGFKPAIYSAYSLNRDAREIILEKSRMLIIDDIGVENEQVNYGERSIVFNEIVDQAERLGQILVLTTNLGKDELVRKYGARTIDRIESLTRKVVFEGESLRDKTS